MVKKTPAVATLLASGILACAGVGERSDSTKILPVDDIYALDSTPPPPPDRVTRMTLLDGLPPGGLCTVKRYAANADQAREVTYTTTTPPRTYVIEVGKPPRPFPPVSLDIRGTEVSPDLTDTENVYGGFTASGSVSVGTRRYSATGRISAIERSPLAMSDSATVLSLARRVLDLCDTGR